MRFYAQGPEGAECRGAAKIAVFCFSCRCGGGVSAPAGESTVTFSAGGVLGVLRHGDAVHAAYVELGTARTALVTRQKSVQLAIENYDVVCKRYANGLALITDLTDAAAMKLDAELALADARIELLYSLYRLKFAAGDL